MMKHPQDNQPTEYPVYTTGFVELRSLIITWTLIAILAVDFNIFPRFHVKSEFYGISLMDIGVFSMHSMKSSGIESILCQKEAM